MFNLETAIHEWREEFGAVDSLRTDDVLELESHLRELVTRLSRGELSEQEAFLVATHRLGQPAELNREFAKVHGAAVWRKRILWMLCGYFVYMLSSQWLDVIATFAAAGIGVTAMGSTMTAVARVSIWAIGWAVLLAFALRKSKNPIAGPDRIPLSWVWMVGFTLVLGYVLRSAGYIVLTRTLEPAYMGDMAQWQYFGFLIVNLCVFVATVALIWTLNEPKSDVMETIG
jgi:hypothetical protein